jgi:hypothetical protein
MHGQRRRHRSDTFARPGGKELFYVGADGQSFVSRRKHADEKYVKSQVVSFKLEFPIDFVEGGTGAAKRLSIGVILPLKTK